ncbi:mitochondrial import inner membrane translocase subunit Tim21 [Euwallacea fornicatus]|uniref:mitochondrial import inner membrane translocase subunit Tim21 n=1 Tax=Euwallacea fornicatus TaxID=995702 RepID=UPI00338EB321
MLVLRHSILSVLVTKHRFHKVFQYHLPKRLKNSDSKLTPTSNSSSSYELDSNVKPLREKVKETTKTTSYLAIIFLGVGICGGLMYTVFNELFSSNSPNNIYSKAVKKCIDHIQVSDKLGYPISAHGDETRRGRRQHVSHAYYSDKEGRKHIRIKFYLKGTAHSGTAHLDMVEGNAGSFEYRFLFVEVDDMFRSIIIVEDNRNSTTVSATPELELKF